MFNTLYLYVYILSFNLLIYIVLSIPSNNHFPSAGCSPPTPPVNGSVSRFTSSRVGAQVTYHCDTDLVLVGERVATCSQSLQWLPSSEDVTCVHVQMPGKFMMYKKMYMLNV